VYNTEIPTIQLMMNIIELSRQTVSVKISFVYRNKLQSRPYTSKLSKNSFRFQQPDMLTRGTQVNVSQTSPSIGKNIRLTQSNSIAQQKWNISEDVPFTRDLIRSPPDWIIYSTSLPQTLHYRLVTFASSTPVHPTTCSSPPLLMWRRLLRRQ